MFSCEFWEIFKNIYFEEHLRTADSGQIASFWLFDRIMSKPLWDELVTVNKLDIQRKWYGIYPSLYILFILRLFKFYFDIPHISNDIKGVTSVEQFSGTSPGVINRNIHIKHNLIMDNNLLDNQNYQPSMSNIQ